MEKSVKLPDNFYERLYDQIMDYGFSPENEDEKTCTMYIDIDDFTVELDATFDVYIEDNSFDHAFGTEHIYDLAVGELDDVFVTKMWHCGDDGEQEVTELYDNEKFWLQFKDFVIKRGSHYIHHGDEVVVKLGSYKFSGWGKVTFLYYDTRLGHAVCTPSIHSKYITRKAYPYVLPATTANLALVKR